MPRVESSRLQHIEELALGCVKRNLERRGWDCKVCDHYQKGYDLEACKKDKRLKIEVKGRSAGEISGYKYDSLVQKKTNRRHFNFSKAQYETGDFFTCVFVFPEKEVCFVVPKRDFNRLRTSEKNPYRITINMDSNVNRGIDISIYKDGWGLLEE